MDSTLPLSPLAAFTADSCFFLCFQCRCGRRGTEGREWEGGEGIKLLKDRGRKTIFKPLIEQMGSEDRHKIGRKGPICKKQRGKVGERGGMGGDAAASGMRGTKDRIQAGDMPERAGTTGFMAGQGQERKKMTYQDHQVRIRSTNLQPCMS